MKASKYIYLLIFCILITTAISAQNLKEGIQNTTQIRESKKNLKRDSAELIAFQSKIDTFNSHFVNKNSRLANQLKKEIVTDMVREVAQSSIKVDKARKEIGQSAAEIRTDNRELRRDRKDLRKSHKDKKDDKKDIRRDRANKRDDKRDLKDDKKDYTAQLNRYNRQSHILKTLKVFNFSFTSNSIASNKTNKKLLDEFLQTLKADLEATKRELKEDKKERREDRRERRDDKKERKEGKRRRW